MNAPRHWNLLKEHLAGVKFFFLRRWQLLSWLPIKKQGVAGLL